MDLSTNDVLFLLGAIELAACVGCALYWLIGRGSEARPARRGTATGRSGAVRPGATAAGPRGERAAGPSPRPGRPAGSVAPAGETASRHPGPDTHAGRASSRAADPDLHEDDDVSDTGRHHVPDELLQASTYRLSADRRARARVPGVAGGLSFQIPGQGRTSADDRRDAAADDVPLHT